MFKTILNLLIGTTEQRAIKQAKRLKKTMIKLGYEPSRNNPNIDCAKCIRIWDYNHTDECNIECTDSEMRIKF